MKTEHAAALPLSPYVRELAPYAFAHLLALKDQVEQQGIEVIDLSIGDIKEPTPQRVKDALAAGVKERSSYPRTEGLLSLRRAAADWVERRFRVSLDPNAHVMSTNGSKEAVFSLHLAVVDPKHRPLVMVPDPAYPVYALGTRAAGGEVYPLPLREENAFLPDLDAISADTWKRTSLLWINYPNNPTGAVAPRAFFEEAAARCREHGVLLASDEAYTELYFEDPPPSALEQGLENILALHTLSKRSAMPGYRSGFLAGDPRLIAALKKLRPSLGVASPQFVQEAAVAAWSDEDHVHELRERFRARRDLVVDGLARIGIEVKNAPATIYVWARTPRGESSESFVMRALQSGVLLVPGVSMGREGEGFFRLSLTAEPEQLKECMRRLERVVLTEAEE